MVELKICGESAAEVLTELHALVDQVTQAGPSTATVAAGADPGPKAVAAPAAWTNPTPAAAPTPAVPVTMAPAMAAPAPAVPVTAPGPSPAPAANAGQTYASPGNRPVPSAPVASAPTITLEQVSKAGADLITADSSRLPALNGLLQRYGIASVQELPAEQIGTFATELRGMGAKI